MSLKKIVRHSNLVIGIVIVSILIFAAIFAPIIAPYDPATYNVIDMLQRPSKLHWFGTDGYGRDLLSRVLYGTRISMTISISVALLSGFFGSVIGLISGYFNKIERPIMCVMDGMMAIPSMLLAMAIVAAFGNGMVNMIIALTIADVPRVVRTVRATVLSVKTMDYVEAAHAMGASDFRILIKYIFPECISPLVVRMTMTMAFTILEEASLTFLGLGLDPATPSWGIILSEGRSYLRLVPTFIIMPGLVLIVSVFGINSLGDGLRDYLDPKLRSL